MLKTKAQTKHTPMGFNLHTFFNFDTNILLGQPPLKVLCRAQINPEFMSLISMRTYCQFALLDWPLKNWANKFWKDVNEHVQVNKTFGKKSKRLPLHYVCEFVWGYERKREWENWNLFNFLMFASLERNFYLEEYITILSLWD